MMDKNPQVRPVQPLQPLQFLAIAAVSKWVTDLWKSKM